MEKALSARQTILYLLSFQGYLPIPKSSSSSTTPPQESLRPESPRASGSGATASSFSDSVLERSDETSSGKLGQKSLRDNKKNEKDPLADMPFWLEDFTDNQIPTEKLAPANISQDSDSEHSAKVATKSKKHSLFTHFP